MEADDLFLRIRNKERAAESEWLNRHGTKVAELGFQYGLSIKDANELSTRTFHKLFKEIQAIENEADLKSDMYQIATGFLENYEQSMMNDFTFEEDDRLHTEIGQQPKDDRLVLLLLSYGHLDEGQVADLLKLTVAEVLQKNKDSIASIAGNHVEKRLELLGKSYRRIHFQVDEQLVFQMEEPMEANVKNQIFNTSKRNVYVGLGGLLLVMGFIFYLVWTSESFQQTRFEKAIEKAKMAYTEKRLATLEEIGLTETDIGTYGGEFLSREENKRFDRYIANIEKNIEKGKQVNYKQVEEEITAFMERLQSPNEMAATLFKKPLRDDFEASEAFLNEYLQKYMALNGIYTERISVEPVVSLLMFNDEDEYIGVAAAIDQADDLPKVVEDMVLKMGNQNMYFDGFSSELDQQKEAFFKEFKEALHPDVSGFAVMLSSLGGGSIWAGIVEPANLSDYLKELEHTLLKTNVNDEVNQYLIFSYMSAIINAMGRASGDLYDESEMISKDYRAKWSQLADHGEDTIVGLLFTRIMQEFEESDWTISPTQIYMDENKIYELINYMKLGDVASYNWEPTFVESQQSIGLPNQGYRYLVDETYEDIKKQQENIANLHPLLVAGIYLQAIDDKDVKMLRILSTEKIDRAMMEAYIEEWQSKEGGMESIYQIHFDANEGAISFSGMNIYGLMRFIQVNGDWVIHRWELDDF